MANIDGAFGLKPIRHPSGSIRNNVNAPGYTIATGYSTSLFRGDPVELTGTGTGKYPGIQVAAAGNVDNLGVFWGCQYVDAQGNQVFSRYWPASTTATSILAFVFDDPQIVFAIQSESGVTPAVTDFGNCCDWAAGTGSTVTGLSAYEADTSALATSGKSLQIMGVLDDPENTLAVHAILEVKFREHIHLGVVSGVGGV